MAAVSDIRAMRMGAGCIRIPCDDVRVACSVEDAAQVTDAGDDAWGCGG